MNLQIVSKDVSMRLRYRAERGQVCVCHNRPPAACCHSMLPQVWSQDTHSKAAWFHQTGIKVLLLMVLHVVCCVFTSHCSRHYLHMLSKQLHCCTLARCCFTATEHQPRLSQKQHPSNDMPGMSNTKAAQRAWWHQASSESKQYRGGEVC